MKSLDDDIRKLVCGEIHKVRPLYLSGVETEEAYGSYDQDFFAASISKMQNYQDKHRRVFCKACVKKGLRDRLVYRRLAIELVPDLLGNDTKQVRSQCFQCDFDMYIPATPELIAVGAHDEYEWNQIRAAVFDAADAGCPPEQTARDLHTLVRQYRDRQQRDEMMQVQQSAQSGRMSSAYAQMQNVRAQAGQGVANSIDSDVMRAFAGGQNTATEARMRQELHDHQLDALRYMNVAPTVIRPLSSAITEQVPMPKRKKK